MMTHTPMLDQSLIEDLRGLAQRNFIGLASCLGYLDDLLTKMATWVMEAEAHFICGARGKHRKTGFQRWGTNPGSVRVGLERIAVRVPRVRDVRTRKERPLQTYRLLRERGLMDRESVTRGLLSGLSRRNYRQAAQVFTDSLGLSASSVGNAFVTQTAALLKEFETRRFDQHTFAVLLLDGKYLAGVQMIVAMGITTEGEKVVLGFAESRTENSAQVESLLQDLLRRGFTHTDKLLVQVDGSRGLRKGISAVFGDAVVFQRCQWHKRTNVTRHIKSEPAATHMKRRLQAAWELPTYKEARAALVSLHGALQRSCPKAARSLEEGLEDTLTLHRLGVRNQAVRDSLKTTNIIENLNSIIANRSRNVKRWGSSGMRQRWCGAIFMEYESNLKPIRREDMKELTQALTTSGGRGASGDSVCRPQGAAKATPGAQCPRAVVRC